MPSITYQLSALLQQQTVTTDHLPDKYAAVKMHFPHTTTIYSSGSWGMMVNQCIAIGEHIYEEQYVEPLEDIEIFLLAKTSMLVLQCMLKGDLTFGCNVYLKEGKLCLHYMPAGNTHSIKLLAGEKYHSFYIIPEIKFIEALSAEYTSFLPLTKALQDNTSVHQMSCVKRFGLAEQNELTKMKRNRLRGYAATVYCNNRISDIILLFFEQMEKPSSREAFLIDLYKKEIDALIIRIDTSPEEMFTVSELATGMGLSEHMLETAFRQKRGNTLLLYVQQQRLKLAKHLLGTTSETIAGIALSVGYADQSYFSRLFKREIGSTPSEYRKSF